MPNALSTDGIIGDPISIMQKSQLRAARALLAWSQQRLAEESGVSLPTIKRLEPGDGALSTKVETMEKLQIALERAGVEFTNSGQPGVRLRLRKFRLKPIDLSHPAWTLSDWKKEAWTKALTETEARFRVTDATFIPIKLDAEQIAPTRPWESADLATCEEKTCSFEIPYGEVFDERGRSIK
jgi:transcriptional regulator with XRE-family HTH domain